MALLKTMIKQKKKSVYGYPCLTMQPKRDAKVKTILHRHAPLLCHIQGQSLQKTGFESTLVSRETVKGFRDRNTLRDTHTEKKKKKESVWTSTSTLISMIHQIITLAM